MDREEIRKSLRKSLKDFVKDSEEGVLETWVDNYTEEIYDLFSQKEKEAREKKLKSAKGKINKKIS